MAITRVACPECRAGLKSPTGFTVGQTVCCPKCETYFAVETQRGGPDDDSDADQPRKKHQDTDEKEWSYKNSWMRYTVLGVLLIVLAVLGYMLYDKKMKESKDNAGTNSGDGENVQVIKNLNAPGGAPQLTPQPPSGGPMQPTPLPAVQLADMQKKLVGNWISGMDAIEYKDDGSFVVTGTAGGAEKTLTGKWKLTSVERGPMGAVVLKIEWTPEGKPSLNDTATLSGERLSEHPILALDGSGKTPGKGFVKK